MKKSIYFALVGLLALSACSKADKPADKVKADAKAEGKTAANDEDVSLKAKALLDGAEFTIGGLKNMFKEEGKLSPAEYEALLLSFAKCEFKETKEGYNYSNCPAAKVYSSEVLNTKTRRQYDKAAAQKTLFKLLKHDNVVVRDKAFASIELLSGNAGLGAMLEGKGALEGDAKAINAILAVAKEEKDPRVFNRIFERLLWIDNLYENRELVDFVLENAKNENAFIRKAIPTKMAAFRMKGIAEAPQMILDLCQKDADADVRNAACAKVLEYDIPDNMKLAADILKNAELAGSHDGIIKSLDSRCYGWPSYQNSDAEAYKMIMDYYKATPRSEKVPHWSTVGAFKNVKADAMEEWKKSATYYNAEELVNVMSDILLDANANWLGRSAASDVILAHGGKAALEKVLPKLQELETAGQDRKAAMLVKHVNDILAKAN